MRVQVSEGVHEAPPLSIAADQSRLAGVRLPAPVIDLTQVAPPSSALANVYATMADPLGSHPTGAHGIKAFNLYQYMPAMKAVDQPCHPLVMTWVDSLHHMGWCEYNTTMGYRIPDAPSGAATKPGMMPHWLLSYPTWVQCWGQFLSILEKRGGDSLLREAMMQLQRYVTSMIHNAEFEADLAWSVAAHFVLDRVHRFLTSLDPQTLSSPPTMFEEREAAGRARSVHTVKPSAPRTPGPSKRRATGPTPRRPAKHCKHHPNATSHDTSECRDGPRRKPESGQ